MLQLQHWALPFASSASKDVVLHPTQSTKAKERIQAVHTRSERSQRAFTTRSKPPTRGHRALSVAQDTLPPPRTRPEHGSSCAFHSSLSGSVARCGYSHPGSCLDGVFLPQVPRSATTTIGHRLCKKVTKRQGEKLRETQRCTALVRVLGWTRSIVPRPRRESHGMYEWAFQGTRARGAGPSRLASFKGSKTTVR